MKSPCRGLYNFYLKRFDQHALLWCGNYCLSTWLTQCRHTLTVISVYVIMHISIAPLFRGYFLYLNMLISLISSTHFCFVFVDYSCAMQKDILVHGRIYISQNWICFYAHILFKWETTVRSRLYSLFTCCYYCNIAVSEIGAVVKVVDSHLWAWGSIPGKSCSFLIVI